MAFDPHKHWNISTANLIGRTLPSNYAIDKEKLFPGNSVVCDLGGGIGVDGLYFISKGHEVYLYDISDIALQKAVEKAGNGNFSEKLHIQQIDLNTDNIPAKDNFFDIVYSRLSLHYFYKDRMEKIFKEIYRVLKEGGTAFIVVKSPEDRREMNWLKKNDKEISPRVYQEGSIIKTRFTKDEYKRILNKAGIKNYEIKDYEEKFGAEKVFVKSKADKLLYIEIIINK